MKPRAAAKLSSWRRCIGRTRCFWIWIWRNPDGLEVYNRLKADTKFTSPVILSIPPSATDRKAVALAQGAEAYLVEPVQPGSLRRGGPVHSAAGTGGT